MRTAWDRQTNVVSLGHNYLPQEGKWGDICETAIIFAITNSGAEMTHFNLK